MVGAALQPHRGKTWTAFLLLSNQSAVIASRAGLLVFAAVRAAAGLLRVQERVVWLPRGPEDAVRSGLASGDSRDRSARPETMSRRGPHRTPHDAQMYRLWAAEALDDDHFPVSWLARHSPGRSTAPPDARARRHDHAAWAAPGHAGRSPRPAFVYCLGSGVGSGPSQ